MLTLNTILKELRNIPIDRLEDVYSIIHSLRVNTKKSEKKRKKILSFAGSLGDMTDADYNDFHDQVKDVRNNLFDRDVKI